jgi:hypothetical protein
MLYSSQLPQDIILVVKCLLEYCLQQHKMSIVSLYLRSEEKKLLEAKVFSKEYLVLEMDFLGSQIFLGSLRRPRG